MTSRSDHQQNNRFRAPQFAMGRAQEQALALQEATAAFSDLPAAPANGDAAPGAPIIVVRRRRLVERPADAPTEESQADAQAKRPRVFQLPRTDGEFEDDDSVAAAMAAPGAAAAPAEAEAATPAYTPPRRRSSTPDFRRAGPVTIAHPLAEATVEHEDDAADAPSLGQLMAQFEDLSARLASLATRRGPRLDLDLSINRRWAAIDGELQALRDSLPPTDRWMTF